MKETNKINILCTPDDNYIPYCGIMLTSLFENNKNYDFDVYVICEAISKINLNNLELLTKHYNANIHIKSVDNNTFNDCPIRVGDHVSIAAYYRLIAADILPKRLDKILYLDCDIIINNDITELYDHNISDYAFAAVIDEAFFYNVKYERLCYDKRYSYINSGVILFNLDYWRKNNLAKKSIEYISKYPERIKFHDQDTLNAVLHKEMKLLPIKYNLQTGFLLTHNTQYYKNELEEIIAAANSPIIIHFTGASKPWYKGSRHPFCNLFLYYKSISLWKDEPLKRYKKSLYNHFIELRNKLIWILGIKKRPQSYIINKYQRL